jgi:recombinational DNA repair protein RecR
MDRRPDLQEKKRRVDRCDRCGMLYSGRQCPVCRTSSEDLEALDAVRSELPWMPAYDERE